MEILVKLLNGDKIVRLGEYSWRWDKRQPGNPSLKNATTSSMFRRDLVERGLKLFIEQTDERVRNLRRNNAKT